MRPTFLTVVVALPIAALVWAVEARGLVGLLGGRLGPRGASRRSKLTLVVAALAALTNAVLGTITAWVLVRDEFRGKALVNAVIDLPFALPTIVAGLVLLTFYGPTLPGRRPPRLHAYRALPRAALRHAALRRAHGAAGAARARPRDGGGRALARRRASSTVFRRIVLPSILPGILSGVTMAFARAVGEIGAVVLITGNQPFRTEVASVFIFNQIASSDPTGAVGGRRSSCSRSPSRVLLAVGGIRRYATRHERA